MSSQGGMISELYLPRNIEEYKRTTHMSDSMNPNSLALSIFIALPIIKIKYPTVIAVIKGVTETQFAGKWAESLRNLM